MRLSEQADRRTGPLLGRLRSDRKGPDRASSDASTRREFLECQFAFRQALEIWPDIVAFAKDHGRKITLENCPMLFSYDEWPGGHNIATTPRMWRRILEQWGDTIGLNFDPSHLILQMIDIGRFLKEFGPHVLHYQAKDLLIDRDGLYENGVFSMGMGWQIPRIPGLGEVDWGVVHGELYRQGYEGDCIIEHEDRRFEGSDEKVKQGFLIARDVLRPYCH